MGTGSPSFDSPDRLLWERKCLKLAKSGDRAAFGELYRVFAPELFRRVLMPRLGNRQAAEDALSETFRTVLERLDRYEDQGKSIWYWLCRVASNKAMDMHRVKGRTGRALSNFESLLAPLMGAVPQADELAFAEVERNTLLTAVSSTLEGINPRYRKAIELRFMEEKSRQDCADSMEVKLGTFDVLLLRALKAFKKEWSTRTQGEGPAEKGQSEERPQKMETSR